MRQAQAELAARLADGDEAVLHHLSVSICVVHHGVEFLQGYGTGQLLEEAREPKS
jgi:hypothetical protein